MKKILIVDDDRRFRKALAENFRRHGRYEILEAAVGSEAIEQLRAQPDICCVLLDYNFDQWGGPGQMNGLQIYERLREIAPSMAIIMMSGVAGIRVVDEAYHQFHVPRFLDKGDFNALVRELGPLIAEDEEVIVQTTDNRRLLSEHGFHAGAATMQAVCRDAIDAALSGLHVLIAGESGTGKTLLARAIHTIAAERGLRGKRLRAIRCSTIPADQMRAALFGPTGPARDGDTTDDQGLLRSSVGDGTCYLDELTALPAHVQAELAALLDGDIHDAHGSGMRTDTDDRSITCPHLIAATGRNIAHALEHGELREDLYYGFGAVLVLPPLRERADDIPGLVACSLNRTPGKDSARATVAQEAMALLQGQPWIGNIRQLFRVIHRARAMTGSGTITMDAVQRALRIEDDMVTIAATGSAPGVDVARRQLARALLSRPRDHEQRVVGGVDEALRDFRREILEQMLGETRGNLAEAARRLGRTKLAAWIEELGIDPEKYR